MSPKTIALNINNLSDARYFAAMNVDFLHFHILHQRPASGIDYTSFLGLSEWVEGPTIICSFEPDVPSNIVEKIRKLSSYGGTLEADRLIINEQTFWLRDISESSNPANEFWLISSNQELKTLNPSVAGIAFLASGETEVGIKDFEHFNELFEALEQVVIQ